MLEVYAKTSANWKQNVMGKNKIHVQAMRIGKVEIEITVRSLSLHTHPLTVVTEARAILRLKLWNGLKRAKLE